MRQIEWRAKLNIIALCLYVCVREGGSWWTAFSLHAWLCHRILISQRMDHSCPWILCVRHHFLLDGSIQQPASGPPLSSVFKGVEVDAPVLIRNVSQSLSWHLAHTLLGKTRESNLSCLSAGLSCTHWVSLAHLLMFYQSHLNGSIPARGGCGASRATLWGRLLLELGSCTSRIKSL